MRCSRKRLVAGALLGALIATSSVARAQPDLPRSEQELAKARKLFAEALHDEDDAHFDVALDKFRRVREVRDTPQIEYHLARCLEGLGLLTAALSTYEAAERLSEGNRAASDVAAGARECIDALSRRVGHLMLVPSSRTPRDADVHVDGRSVPASGDLVLDPGRHHVEAEAQGVPPFQSDLTLPEGGRVALVLPLDSSPLAPVARGSDGPEQVHGAREERSRSGGENGPSRTWGWVLLSTGGVLLAGSVVTFLARETDIRTVNRDCPGGGCVGFIPDDAEAAANRARIEGPVGWTLGAAGLAAAGAGVYLAWKSRANASAWVLVPQPFRAGAGLGLRGYL